MSLIDDALRRAREEAALQEAAKRPGSSRWAPSHIPRRRRSAWKGAGGLAAVFLAGSAAAWLFFARAPGRSVPVPVVRPSTPAASLPVPVAAPAPAPPRRIEPPARTRARRSAGENPPAPAAAAPQESSAAASNTAAPPPAGQSGQRTFVHTATLAGGQTIELGGIVYSESNPVALINGKVVAPGSLVGDFTVVQIRPERVDFSGNGTTFSILLH
jgi:hypothetical protein